VYRMETQPLAVLPPSGWSKKTILVRFDDDTTNQKANGNVVVYLTDPIENVVFAEWVAVSPTFVNPNCRLVNIREFNNNGDTTKSNTGSQNVAFWRCINTETNYAYEPLPNMIMPPFSLNRLTISVRNTLGTAVNLTGLWMVVDLWTSKPETQKLNSR